MKKQLCWFATIGVLSTITYSVLYVLLREATSATASNALALLLTALANTEANRRLTFDVRGSDGLARDHAGGLIAFAIALGITSGSAMALQLGAPDAGRGIELTVLVASSVLATAVRFVLLRAWIHQPRRRPALLSGRLERIAQ